MAQNKISLNLSSADFTLSYSFKGRSVIVPGQDQNFFGSTGSWAGASPQKGVDIPQLYYCENVVPTSEGYRSVAYRFSVDPPEEPQTFVRIYNIFDGFSNSGLLGITADRKLFLVAPSTNGLWEELTFPMGYVWDTPSQVTVTTVVGYVALCIQGVGVFNIDINGVTLIAATLIGLDPELINGVCSSNSILIAWDDTTVYWSSAINPLDFTPSLITGAGSTKPEGLKGTIQLCKEIKGGFIVYSDVVIIGASYTQTTAFSWIFDSLEGATGVTSPEAVAYDINLSAHFAWTTAGLAQIGLNKVELLFPAITDFIASGLSDTTVAYTDYPSAEFSPETKEVRLAAISARYLCVSFGYLVASEEPNTFPTPALVQSFLYDSQLRRWGKLKVNHIQILEAPFTASPAVFF